MDDAPSPYHVRAPLRPPYRILHKTLDPLPLTRFILAVVAALPPNTACIGRVNHAALMGMLIIQEINKLIFAIANKLCKVIKGFLQFFRYRICVLLCHRDVMASIMHAKRVLHYTTLLKTQMRAGMFLS